MSVPLLSGEVLQKIFCEIKFSQVVFSSWYLRKVASIGTNDAGGRRSIKFVVKGTRGVVGGGFSEVRHEGMFRMNRRLVVGPIDKGLRS